MELNKKQTEKATKLLELLCEYKSLNNTQVDSFFNNAEEELFICKELEKKNLLKAIWLDGNKIATLNSNEYTCNALTNDFLIKDFTRQAKFEKKDNLEIKIKQIELLKQYWWVGGIILTIMGWILYVILF